MAERELEKVIQERVKPMLDEAMAKFLGVTIREINTDITDRLKRNPVFEMEIDTALSFKKAKDEFKKSYLARLLRLNFGNVSEVSRIAGIDRRSVHRLVKKFRLNAETSRKDMFSSEYIKAQAVQGIIESTLEHYKGVLNPEKLARLYSTATNLSREIIKELPDEPLTFKEAEMAFERKFLHRIMQLEPSPMKAAKRLGIRYETLHRKLRTLSLI